MNVTISKQYSINGTQVIDYIQNNFITLHPKCGMMRVSLQQHQKMLVHEILQENNIIRQARQSGISSLFVWIAQAITAINPNIKVAIYVQFSKQKQNLIRISQLNGIEININYINQHFPARITHLQLYDLSGSYTDQINTLLVHTNLQLDDSKLISIINSQRIH